MTPDDEALPLLLEVAQIGGAGRRRQALEDLGVIDGEEAAELLGRPEIIAEIRRGRVPPALRSELRQVAMARRQAWLAEERGQGVQGAPGVSP